MGIINPNNPLCNTIIFYIIIFSIILIIKPSFMYCDKTNKFKQFGCQEGQTIFCLPLITISIGIILYIFFLFIEIVYNSINKK